MPRAPDSCERGRVINTWQLASSFKVTYVPPPSMAAVVYGAMLIDKGTRTGVSILYVSDPRCSKRCRGAVTRILA